MGGRPSRRRPATSIVNPAQNTAVAIELKQVESDVPKQVHTLLYLALDQLLLREQFDSTIKYTRWKAYIYVNAGNPWPRTTDTDLPTLMANRKAEELASSHWTNWKTKYGTKAKVDVSIWLGGHGMIRENYSLE